MGKLTISMAIFNSYFDITRGYLQWEFMGPMIESIPPSRWILGVALGLGSSRATDGSESI